MRIWGNVFFQFIVHFAGLILKLLSEVINFLNLCMSEKVFSLSHLSADLAG